VQKLAGLLAISSESIRERMNKTAQPQVQRLKNVKTRPEISNHEDYQEQRKLEDRLLCITFTLPRLRGYIEDLHETMFVQEPAMKLFQFLKANPEFDGQGNAARNLQQISEYVKIITLQFEELYAGVELLELQYEAARLRTRLVELFVKDQKKQIIAQMDQAAETEQTPYLEKVRELDQLLKRTKE